MEQELARFIYALELKRVKYLLRSYFRTRLKKIQMHAAHILDEVELQMNLSDKELAFAKDFFMLQGKYVRPTRQCDLASHEDEVRSPKTSLGGMTDEDHVVGPPAAVIQFVGEAVIKQRQEGHGGAARPPNQCILQGLGGLRNSGPR
jgi:GINS complex protein